MNEYPDLPGLESVEFGEKFSSKNTFIVSLSIIFFMISFLIYSSDPHALWNIVTAAALLLISVLLIIPLRFRMFDSMWKTDSQGITAYGFLLKRRIEWHQVREAETRWGNMLIGERFIIKSADETIIVPVKDAYLSASIWQHLRRVNKEVYFFSPEVTALWKKIPEDVPHQMIWVNPRPPSWLAVILGTIILLVVRIYLAPCIRETENPFFHYSVPILSVYIITAFIRRLFIARRFTLSENHFEAEMLLRRVSLRWEELRQVKWDDNLTRVELRKSIISVVYLPWFSWDEESTQLIQAIARNLRELPKPVQLPLPDDFTENEAPESI